MVEKGLGRESDEVIVGVRTDGLKRFIVQLPIYKIVHEQEIRCIRKVVAKPWETIYIERGNMYKYYSRKRSNNNGII